MEQRKHQARLEDLRKNFPLVDSPAVGVAPNISTHVQPVHPALRGHFILPPTTEVYQDSLLNTGSIGLRIRTAMVEQVQPVLSREAWEIVGISCQFTAIGVANRVPELQVRTQGDLNSALYIGSPAGFIVAGQVVQLSWGSGIAEKNAAGTALLFNRTLPPRLIIGPTQEVTLLMNGGLLADQWQNFRVLFYRYFLQHTQDA